MPKPKSVRVLTMTPALAKALREWREVERDMSEWLVNTKKPYAPLARRGLKARSRLIDAYDALAVEVKRD